MHTIKKIKVKVKEKYGQFLVMICCFLLLFLLICGSVLLQSVQAHTLSKEQQRTVTKETGALRDDLETETDQLANHLTVLKEDISASQSVIETMEQEMTDQSGRSDRALHTAMDELAQMKLLIDEDMNRSLEAIQGMIGILRENRDGSRMEEVSALLSQIEKKIDEKTEGGEFETNSLLHQFVKEYSERNDNLEKQMEQGFFSQNTTIAENQAAVMTGIKSAQSSLHDLQDSNDLISEKMDLHQADMERLGEAAEGQFADLTALVEEDSGALSDQIREVYDKNTSMNEEMSEMRQDIGNIYGTLSQILQLFESVNDAIFNIEQRLQPEGGGEPQEP